MCVLCMYRVSELGIILYSVLYTENVARGGKLSFQNVHGRGGEGVYDILTFQKSRGGLGLRHFTRRRTFRKCAHMEG